MLADKRIGKYRIQRELSRDASTSVVYLAFDGQCHVSIQVWQKLVPAHAEALFAQARSFPRRNHPNLVRYLDHGWTEEGRCYIVSEFIDGFTLRETVQKKSLTYDESARLVATIAQALHQVHQQGELHGNLHVGHILLEAITGKPYITDFALPYRGDDGMIVGNPSHLSPEQVRGELHRLDGRTDVYSLGIMLYELLTGVRPFRGGGFECIDQILSAAPVPPSKLNGTIPVELERICLKALAKQMSDRYSTAGELADDLTNWQTPASRGGR